MLRISTLTHPHAHLPGQEGIFKQTGRHYAGIKQTASGVPLTQVVNASGRKDTTASGGGKDGGRTLVKSSHPVPGSGFTVG